MDIGKAFTFINEDERWFEKVGIGVGLVIVGFLIVPIFILNGYAIRLLQNVRDDHEKPLPNWDDWSGDLIRGFKMWLIQIIWALPLILFTMPVAIGAAIADTGGAGEFVGVSLMLCAGCLTILYGLFMALAAPAYTISFAHDESIGKGLALTAIWRWTQQNLGQVIIAALVILAAGFIVMSLAGLVGLILCGVGLFLTIPLASVVLAFFQNHLYGQLAKEYPMYGGASAVEPAAPAPVAPTQAVPGEEIDADEPVAQDGTAPGMVEEIAEEPIIDEAVVVVPVVEEVIDETTDEVVAAMDEVEAVVDVPVEEVPAAETPDAPTADAGDELSSSEESEAGAS